MANDLKSRIEQRLKELGITARAASLSVGDKPDLIRSVLRGYSQNPRADSIKKIADALGVTEQWLLTGDDDAPSEDFRGEARRAPVKLPPRAAMSRDVPVLGTAAGSVTGSFLFEDGIVDWVRRPPALEGAKDVYAIYVQGDSMGDAHPAGELRFVHPHRPCKAGDTVIIQLRAGEHADTEAYIKILVGRKNGKIVTRQLNPEATIEFEQTYIIAMHRVMTLSELFGV